MTVIILFCRRETPQHYALHMNHIAEDFVSLVASTRDAETHVLAGFKDLVYRAGLETVSNVALEKRMGFLDRRISASTQLILDSIQGYQVLRRIPKLMTITRTLFDCLLASQNS